MEVERKTKKGAPHFAEKPLSSQYGRDERIRTSDPLHPMQMR